MTDFLTEFLKDRDAALLSMDKAMILAYMKKYQVPIPPEDRLLWIVVHKARTGATSLPMFERAASKKWLHEHGSQSLDDGDVLPPKNDSELKKYYERCKELGCRNYQRSFRN